MKDSPIGELAWQAQWARGEWGNVFQTEDGRRVEIHHPGRWNREPGPDFRNAIVAFDHQEPKRGDIEFDLRASDWEAHGHAVNPDFEDVVLHVFPHRGRLTCFSRTLSHREIPQVCLENQPIAKVSTPVRLPFLPECDHEKRIAWVKEAAVRRLQRKAGNLRKQIAVHGADETLYQALAAALGYKHNAVALSIVAQRVTLHEARRASGEALLYGIAGFLDGGRFAIYSGLTRQYVRSLWDHWWSQRAGASRLILPASAWRSGAVRPANHPHRRIAALHLLARNWTAVRKAFTDPRPERLLGTLKSLTHPYWESHAKLDGTRLRRRTALIGVSRAADILANVFYPWRVMHRDDIWDDYLRRPAPQASTLVRHAACHLFGKSESAAILRRLALQQGLLELRIADLPAMEVASRRPVYADDP